MINEYILKLSCILGGWPLIFYVIGVGILCTFALGFIQFRYFIKAWQLTLFSSQAREKKEGEMSPFQAFLNTLSANLGNGSIAGMATAIYSGGPGAAFWVLVIGFVLMSVRFAEVYLSTSFGTRAIAKTGLGGPMLYLKSVFAGNALAFFYAIFTLGLSFILGSGMQANSIRLSLAKTWNVPPIVTALVILIFIAYVVRGGAARIAKATEKIVPLKVIVFFGSAFIVLIYHYASLLSALKLIVISGFTPVALAGGLLGFTVQQAMRFGIIRSIMATESGLGTAAILFGSTGSSDPMRDGIMSMLSTFISTLVCFLISLCIVASGVWNSGFNSTELTIAAFNTVFGNFGGWVVSFLSVSFGIGVMVAFAYITRQAWAYLTSGRYMWLCDSLYCIITFFSALADVNALWALCDIFTIGMLAINLYAIVYLLPIIRRGVAEYQQKS